MLAIIARLEFKPEHAEEYTAALAELIEPTLAEEGCLLYSFGRDVKNPNVVWAIEQWESQEALNAHLVAPHIKRLFEKTAHLEIISNDDRQYEVSSVGHVQMPE